MDQPSSPPSFDSKPMQIPSEQDGQTLLTRRIHILGLGSIGTFIAHSLKCLPNPPPMSLLMHRPEMYEEFKAKSRIIRLINKKSEINDEQTGYDVDLLENDTETDAAYWRFVPDTPSRGVPTNPWNKDETLPSGELYISSLIVTVKADVAVTALRSIKHRVNAQTTICLIQNGMGQVDQLNRAVFTDPETRPTYILGIISHGAHMSSSFAVIHAGFGTTALGIYRDLDKFPLPPKAPIPNMAELAEVDRKRFYPTDEELYSNISSRYLLRTLTRSPILACAGFPYLDLFQLQLEKLAMNAILNPLTALLNVPNGAMLQNESLAKAQRLLIAEISMVLRGLPELEGVPNVRMRFSPDRLETLFRNISQKTAENSSSMREDVRKAKDTEIDYINGYIVKRGEQQGIKCVLNYMVMQLILGKTRSQKGVAAPIVPYNTSQLSGEVQTDALGEPSGVILDDQGVPARGKNV